MKRIFIVLSIPLTLCVNILMAQNENCQLIGTKWKIKNIDIKRVGGSIEDSLFKKRFYQEYDSVQINFYSKKYLVASWKKYKIQGKYKIKRTKEEQILNLSFSNLEFYEKGPIEKALFASFLYELKSYPIHFLNDCSFVMVVEQKGVLSKIFYEKVD